MTILSEYWKKETNLRVQNPKWIPINKQLFFEDSVITYATLDLWKHLELMASKKTIFVIASPVCIIEILSKIYCPCLWISTRSKIPMKSTKNVINTSVALAGYKDIYVKTLAAWEYMYVPSNEA